MMAHEALAPPPSDTEEEEDPACCVLCGEKLDDATCSEHVSRCFDEHLPIDPPPPPSKRQRLSDAAERTGSGQPLFGERMPYLPRELGILAIDQPVFSVADLISMLRVSRVRPTPVGRGPRGRPQTALLVQLWRDCIDTILRKRHAALVARLESLMPRSMRTCGCTLPVCWRTSPGPTLSDVVEAVVCLGHDLTATRLQLSLRTMTGKTLRWMMTAVRPARPSLPRAIAGASPSAPCAARRRVGRAARRCVAC